jgi:hypothetical protein
VHYFADTPAGRQLRAAGAVRLMTVSAALQAGEAAGFHVGTAGLTRAAPRDGKVVVHFGVLPDAEGWCAADAARPDADLLGYIRPAPGLSGGHGCPQTGVNQKSG